MQLGLNAQTEMRNDDEPAPMSQRRATVPACHSLAEQAREARRLKQQALQRQQAKDANAAEKEVELKDQPRPGYRRFYDLEDLRLKQAWADTLAGDTKDTLVKHLERAQELGSYRRVVKAPDPQILVELRRDFPNFDAVTDLIERRLHLCRMAPEQLLKLPPVLLDGPPGVGKTAYCRRLAKLMGIRFEMQDLSSSATSFAMTGLDAGYSTGKPGRIWDSLMHECISVLWLLDELDKPESSTKESSVNYLLGLLEPVSAMSFADSAAQLPVDASWICWIATSNERERIAAPVRSRFQVLQVQTPTPAQMRAVVVSIQCEIHAGQDWAQAFEAELAPELIDALSASSPREIRQRLEDAYASAAAQQRTYLLLSDLQPTKATDDRRPRIGFI